MRFELKSMPVVIEFPDAGGAVSALFANVPVSEQTLHTVLLARLAEIAAANNAMIAHALELAHALAVREGLVQKEEVVAQGQGPQDPTFEAKSPLPEGEDPLGLG